MMQREHTWAQCAELPLTKKLFTSLESGHRKWPGHFSVFIYPFFFSPLQVELFPALALCINLESTYHKDFS